MENQELPVVIETRSSEVIVSQKFAQLPVIPAPSKFFGITISMGQISALTKQIETLVNQNQQLQNRIQTLNEILINLNNEKFGGKSKQTKFPIKE